MFIDESHVTIPQVRAMYNGDLSERFHWLILVLGSHLP